nr:hypothetical protein Iba_chr11bCG7410 [Ipomoea batatas]GMD57021.1 hypothetical protein Iba_chr11eCG8750 [Ipomoea batatas]GME05240.1 hypothetical protein Iba_scaffold2753CG0020 [Ipomoea batatas]
MSKLNLDISMAKMILASMRAKDWPTQFRGPAANGRKFRAAGPAKDFDAKRSGLNSFTPNFVLPRGVASKEHYGPCE